jgi:hypothetical protein
MTDVEPAPLPEHLRKRSVAAFELTDSSGRRRTVQLDELGEADAALAEKFGYKPVRAHQSTIHQA